MRKTKVQNIGVFLSGGQNWIGGINYTESILYGISLLPSTVRLKYRIYLFIDASQSSLMSRFARYVDEICIISAFQYKVLRLISELQFIKLPLYKCLKCLRNIDFLYPFPYKVHGMATVGWIPDFQYQKYPKYFDQTVIMRMRTAHQKVSERAPALIFSSQDALQDFNIFFPNEYIRTYVYHFVSTIHLFLPNHDLPELFSKLLEKYNLPERYFIVSNQFWQHKNHRIVFKAMHYLAEQGGNVSVVFTGLTEDHRNLEYFEKLIDEEVSVDIKSDCFILGLIPRQDQTVLFANALAVIQPSLFEGWSTIVEDAKLLEKHIILSEIPVHLEQFPNNVTYFSPEDEVSLANAMASLWHDSANSWSYDMHHIQDKHVKAAEKFLRIVDVELQEN